VRWPRAPRLRLLAQAALVVGLVGVLWLAVGTVRAWLYYESIGREPYRTNALRIAAKQIWASLVDPYYDARLRRDATLPAYSIDMTDRRVAEWRTMLATVYARGFAVPEDHVLQPAKLRFRDREWQVDVRGRGTLYTHYRAEKPSFRVRFPGDEYLRGNRVINLVIPYDQARVNMDTTLNAIARQYGLLTYPTRFVTLELNGDLLGVYQEIEHFREELGVKQYRSEGFFMNGLGELKGGAALEKNPRLLRAAEAVAGCMVECDEATARHVLDTYLDIDRMAFYAALTSVFGSSHAWGEDNLILFFDPPRGRFEPVPWDMGSIWLQWNDADPQAGLESVKGLGGHLLRLPEFRARRNAYLMDLLRRKQAFAEREAARRYAALRPALDYDSEHTRFYARRLVRRFDEGIERNFGLWARLFERTRLQASVAGDTLELRNLEPAPVRVERIHLATAAGPLELAVGQELVGAYRDLAGRLQLSLPPGTVVQGVRLEGRQLFTERALEAADVEWQPSAPAFVDLAPAGFPPPPLPGITVEVGPDGTTWVYTGTIRLLESLVQPEGIHARFEPGLRVEMGGDTQWILRGDLISIGTPERPIQITAIDQTKPWDNFIVIGRTDRMAHAVVEHTTWSWGSEGEWRGAYFTGMVSFYDASLIMRHSLIEEVRGEDGLNVKFGFVELRDNVFAKTDSDAVDLDFCTGTLTHNVVEVTAGDGLDFSGSLILARDNRLVRDADKGLSIGESTTLLAVDNVVDHPNTGMAVKDQSWAEIRGGQVLGAAIGLSSYQKKPVFGSGVSTVTCQDVQAPQTRFLFDHHAWATVLPCEQL
jgi:hypothetical protein